ncbi:MAG: hypothetical protein WCW84_07890 [Sulfurimonas sp.]|jgi:membrane protein YdbS with pleckstrin-like domain
MSKKDKVQAKITWLQVFFMLIATAYFSMVGWLVTAEKIRPISGIVAAIAIIIFTVLLVYFNNKILEHIDELEEL